jgi:hypothetical protein
MKMNMNGVIFPGILIGLGFSALVVITSFFLTIKYLRPHRGKAVLAWIAALCMGVIICISRGTNHAYNLGVPRELLWFLGGALLGIFLIPFLVKLERRILCGELSAEEKAIGWEGIRAWVRGGNLVCCLGISVCAWQGFGYTFWGVLALTLGVLVAYPLLNLLSQPQATVPPLARPAGDLSAEREKVLKLLEDGKITAVECAELLNALGETMKNTEALPTGVHTMNSAQKMTLAGGGLILLAFFLPWFSFNPGEEMQRVTGQMQEQMQGMMPAGANLPNAPLNFGLQTGSVNVSGGDIGHGLGWLVLLLGAMVIALPYMADQLDRRTRWNITVAMLAAGTIILFYLFTENLRYATIGIFLAIAGYGMIFAGSMKQRRSLL